MSDDLTKDGEYAWFKYKGVVEGLETRDRRHVFLDGFSMAWHDGKSVGPVDEVFVKEHINPIVGYIFHSAKQLGRDNAPNEMDWKYLREGTQMIKELLERRK